MSSRLICSFALSLFLLGSCSPVSSPQPTPASAMLSAPMPTTLGGCTLMLNPAQATYYATGSGGMDAAIQSKYLAYKTWNWQPSPSPEDSIRFKSITFSGNRWMSGMQSGPCSYEKVEDNKLFVTLLPDEAAFSRGEDDRTIYDPISFLLVFSDASSGVAIWGAEHSFAGNLHFSLQR